MRLPETTDVEEVLTDLIEGRMSREQAASWAQPWVIADEPPAVPEAVWDALVELAGADLKTIDRPYLYDKADFRAWLGKLREG